MSRCNYCNSDSVVRFSWPDYIISRGHRKFLRIIVQACAEHEGCVNWNGHRELKPDAAIERLINGKWVKE